MRKIFSGKTQSQRGGTGVFLIVLLAVIFLGVALVPWWTKKKTPDPDMVQDMTPWAEWSIRQSSHKPAVEQNEDQPKITEPLLLEARINDLESGEDRGDLAMLISPGGLIEGKWYGSYYKAKKVNCDITGAKFEGMAYPGKIYKDDSGEDHSRLYFLTSGAFESCS